MKNLPKISDAEWEIMKALWNEEPLTSEQINELLGEKMNWTSATIKTFMGRLVKKEAISYIKKGRARYYYPLISETECKRYETRTFIKKIFDGAASVLLSNFIEDKELTLGEIEDIEKILKEKKERINEGNKNDK